MATRVKTVEYFFEIDTSDLATATRRDFSAITVYIPESSPTFRSVSAHVSCTTTSATNTTAFLGGIKLGAVAFSDTSVSETVSASGETYSIETMFDFTSYFTTNWSGTSMSCQVGVQYTGPTTRNHTVKLLITYEYDDSATTRLKTVRIPIESGNGVLSTTWESVGGTTPIIDTNDLPEASVTIRQAALTLLAQEDTASTTDFTVEYRINGGTAQTFWAAEAGTNAALSIISHNDVTADLSTTAYSLEAQTVTQTNRVTDLCGVLTITYEYDHSSSTSIWNSFLVENPFDAYEHYAVQVGSGSGDEAYGEVDFWVNESGTLSLEPSAILFYGTSVAVAGSNVKVGSQASYTSYPGSGSGGVRCGTEYIMHKFDSSGSGGSGITLAKGKNSVGVHYYGGSISNGKDVASSVVYVNYTSGKTTDDANHNHSVYQHVMDSASANIYHEAPSTVAAVTIPETNYFINAFMPFHISHETYNWNNVRLYYAGSEGKASGSGMIGCPVAGRGDVERRPVQGFHSGILNRFVYRWDGDADPEGIRIDPEATRGWAHFGFNNQAPSIGCWTTYHSITSTVSGTLYDYAGDGSGVTVELHDADSGELLKTTTSATGGSFSFTWYDDSRNLYCSAREDDTHTGRSNTGSAS